MLVLIQNTVQEKVSTKNLGPFEYLGTGSPKETDHQVACAPPPARRQNSLCGYTETYSACFTLSECSAHFSSSQSKPTSKELSHTSPHLVVTPHTRRQACALKESCVVKFRFISCSPTSHTPISHETSGPSILPTPNFIDSHSNPSDEIPSTSTPTNSPRPTVASPSVPVRVSGFPKPSTSSPGPGPSVVQFCGWEAEIIVASCLQHHRHKFHNCTEAPADYLLCNSIPVTPAPNPTTSEQSQSGYCGLSVREISAECGRLCAQGKGRQIPTADIPSRCYIICMKNPGEYLRCSSESGDPRTAEVTQPPAPCGFSTNLTSECSGICVCAAGDVGCMIDRGFIGDSCAEHCSALNIWPWQPNPSPCTSDIVPPVTNSTSTNTTEMSEHAKQNITITPVNPADPISTITPTSCGRACELDGWATLLVYPIKVITEPWYPTTIYDRIIMYENGINSTISGASTIYPPFPTLPAVLTWTDARFDNIVL